jgi:acid phosphatase (class A)
MSHLSRRLRAGAFAVMVAALVLAPLSRADSRPTAPAPHYADFSGLDIAGVLPAPPAPGSLAGRADLETVLQVQAARTPEQVSWAQRVDTGDTFALFGDENLPGPEFTRANHPALAQLIANDREDLTPVYKAAKRLFARTRPYDLDPRVHPCVRKPADDSYPSGHTYRAFLDAEVLSQIYPERRAELFDRARHIAWARIIGGVHFPTDLEGGRLLAAAVMAAELKDAAFKAALEACRSEALAPAH